MGGEKEEEEEERIVAQKRCRASSSLHGIEAGDAGCVPSQREMKDACERGLGQRRRGEEGGEGKFIITVEELRDVGRPPSPLPPCRLLPPLHHL